MALKCLQVMRDVLRAKFAHNANLRRELLSTGNAVLVEASSHDAFWGAGRSLDDARLADRCSWPGKNTLGFLLMELRWALHVEAK